MRRPRLSSTGPLSKAVLTLTLLAAGCNQAEAPKGQVVATVDGTEITIAELNEEARSRGLTIAQDPELRNALLQELIGRKLLVEEAVEQGFDRSPQFMLAKRRSEEILLGQQLLAAAAQAWTPSPEEVRRYIAENPAAFAQRALITVDSVSVPRRLPEPVRRAIASAASVELMEQQLAKAGVVGTRSTQIWDSAALPQRWRQMLLRLSPGQNFVLPAVTGQVAGKLVSITAQPVPPSQSAQVAREALNRRSMDVILKRILDSRRGAAEIRYNPEFAPKAGRPPTQR